MLSVPAARMTSPACMPARAAAPLACSTTSPPLTCNCRCSSALSGRTARPRRPGLAAGSVSLAAALSEGTSPRLTFRSRLEPPRHTCKLTDCPGLSSPMTLGRSEDFSMTVPSTVRITSPAAMPAFSAGLSRSTEVTSAPSGLARPNDSASSLVTPCTPIPRRPRLTLPYCCNWSLTFIATSIGIAKDRPM